MSTRSRLFERAQSLGHFLRQRKMACRKPLRPGRRGREWRASPLEMLEQRVFLTSVSWTGAGDGISWQDIDNWSTQVLPTAGDDVVVGTSGSTLQLSTEAGVVHIHSLSIDAPLNISNGGVLEVDTTISASQSLTLSNGGTIRNATISTTGSSILVENWGVLDAVALASDLDIPVGQLQIRNGLTLTNANIRFNNVNAPWWIGPQLYFVGSQSLQGTGNLLFSGTNAQGSIYADSTLTIGAGILIESDGWSGFISGNAIINEGTILSNTLGHAITINPTTFVNLGAVEATGGGVMSIYGLSGNVGSVALSGDASRVNLYGVDYIINQAVSVPAGTVLLLEGAWSNTSTITAVGGTLNLGDQNSYNLNAWTNAGTISATDATVNLGGNFTLSELGDLSRSGGTVNVVGTLELGGGEMLALDATTGSWRLAGGTIRGGTIDTSGGAQLVPMGGKLDGVTLASDLEIPSGQLQVVNGLTLANADIRFNNVDGGWWNAPRLYFAGSQSLQGTGNVMFSGSSAQGSIDVDTSLTIEAGIVIESDGWSGSIGGNTIINEGTIRANDAGLTVSISLTSLVNVGTLEVVDGGAMNVSGISSGLGDVTISGADSSLRLNGSEYIIDQGLSVPAGTTLWLEGMWSNASTITAVGGTLNLGDQNNWSINAWTNDGTIIATDATVNLGGNFTLTGLGNFSRSGGTVNVTGTLELGGGEMLALDATTGSWRLTGGTIRGGTIVTTGGAQLVPMGGKFDGVTLESDLEIPSGQLQIVNGLTLLNVDIRFNNVDGAWWNSPQLYFAGSQSLQGTGNLLFSGTNAQGSIYADSTLTIGTGIVIETDGWSGTIGGNTIINEGTIRADDAGQTMSISPTSFINHGIVEVVGGGVMSLLGAWINDSSVTAVGGTLNLGDQYNWSNNAWTNDGTISATDSTVNLGGNFTLALLGSFSRSGGTVNITGTLDLGSVAPGHLTASQGEDYVALRWTDDSVTEAGYKVERSLDGVNWTQIGTVGENITHYQDTGLDEGTTYYYRLRANSEFGDSVYSEVVSAITGTLGHGLLASYFDNNDLTNLTLTRTEAQVDFDWGWGGSPNAAIAGDTWSARWTGQLEAQYSETYTFEAWQDDQVKVWVDGQLVVDHWDYTVVNNPLALVTGQTYDMVVEYAQLGAWANVHLYWSSPSTPQQIIPADQFYLPADAGSAFTPNVAGPSVTVTEENTLSLDATTESWRLNGGTIRGGTIDTLGGAQLVPVGGKIDGVTLASDLEIPSGQLQIVHGLTLSNADIRFNNVDGAWWNSPQLYFAGNQSLHGTGNLLFSGSSVQGSIHADSTLTIEAGIVIESDGRGGAISGNTIINEGTIHADDAGQTITLNPTVFVNGGTLQVEAGGILSLQANTFIDAQGSLVSSPSGSIMVYGNLLGNTTNTDGWGVAGPVTFTGGGYGPTPRLLEAMSEDKGATIAGFQANFAYSHLVLSNGTYLRLVDESPNSGGGANAVYASSVLVPEGATLDLNGLNVYTLAASVTGEVVNGTITLLPGSSFPDLSPQGVLATSDSNGNLTVTWTDMNDGGGNVEASYFDQVQLVDVTSNTVLGTVHVYYDAGSRGPIAYNGGTASQQAGFNLASFPGFHVGDELQVVVSVDVNHVIFETTKDNNESTVAVGQAALPDLQVTGLGTIPASGLTSGQTVSIVWQDTNTGSGPTASNWLDRVVVVNTATGQTLCDSFAGSFANLAAGSSQSRQFDLTLPNGIAGVGDLQITVTVDAFGQVFEDNPADPGEANNAGSKSMQSTLAAYPDLKVQNVTVSPAVPHSGQSVTIQWEDVDTGVGNASGSWLDYVQLVNVSTGQTLLQTWVNSGNISAGGSATRSFEFTLPGDVSGVGDMQVIVTADISNSVFEHNVAGDAEQNNTGTANFTSVVTPVLTLSLPSSAAEGDSITASVSRNFDLANLLTVALTFNRPIQFVMPAFVVIPAGETSVEFVIQAVQDTISEKNQAVTVTAAADSLSVAKSITIFDDDVPEISLSITPGQISEAAGPAAAVGTVTRSFTSDRPFSVRLTSSDLSKATVPAVVVIPAGELSVSFAIGAVDNNVLDGASTVSILARGVYEACGCTVPGGDTVVLQMTDNESPSLAISLSQASVLEGGSINATISRNGDLTNALLVTLALSDPGEATVPATVEIPAGETSATFQISAIEDGDSDGRSTITIVAAAPSLNEATAQLTINDANLPDLSVSWIAVPANVSTDTTFNVTYRVTNNGLLPATGTLTERLVLSTNGQISNGIFAGQYSINGTLQPGTSFDRTVQVTAPHNAGTYQLIVQGDLLDLIDEADESNNVSVSAGIAVSAEYTATVSTPTTVAPAGTPVPLSGHAILANGSSPAPFKLVSIHIAVRGTERVIAAFTDANGNFSTVFTPLAGEGGNYTIGASHPGVSTYDVQDGFALVGMKAQPGSSEVSMIEGSAPVIIPVTITNLSDIPLTGLSVSVLNVPANLTAGVDLNSVTTLAGNAEIPLTVTLSALDASVADSALIMRLTSAEGAVTDIPIGVHVEALQARLAIDRESLNVGVVRGGQNVVEFTVRNDGGIASGPLTLNLPGISWLTSTTSTELASLLPGESARIVLQFTPPEDAPLGVFSGTIGVSGTNCFLAIPTSIRLLSDAVTSMTVVVQDEYTFFADGAPNVAGATVVVRNALTNVEVTQGVTAANGTLLIPSIPEGYYTLHISADTHSTVEVTVFAAAGDDNVFEIFTSRQLVTYTFSVVPTTVADETVVTIEATFETNVPAPVVVVEPLSIDISDLTEVGQQRQIDLKVSNYGLIAAQDVSFTLPSDPAFEFIALTTDIGVLPANSSLTIPLIARRIALDTPEVSQNSLSSTSALGALATQDLSISLGWGQCQTTMAFGWRLICGPRVYGWSILLSVKLRHGCGPDIPRPVNWKPFGEGLLGEGGNPLTGGGWLFPQRSLMEDCYLEIAGDEPESLATSLGSIQGTLPFTESLQPSNLSTGYTISDLPGVGFCAAVTFAIDQTVMQARDAFAATLGVGNNTDHSITEISSGIVIYDSFDNDVTDLFLIQAPSLNGISAVDGTGVLSENSTGRAQWLIVPTLDAAPTSFPVQYHVGGTLAYNDDGVRISVAIQPQTITVYPQPELTLDYFLQRDVLGDDPFTATVEPSVPFVLGVQLRNQGYGEAQNLSIASAQPRIIDNDRGLLINFQILATEVDGNTLTPSLTADFGDVAPGSIRQARWFMTSSLQGLFIDYSATFANTTGFGADRLSLIRGVNIHELIRSVLDYGAGADSLADFLVNDVADANDSPDTLYNSLGQTSPVSIFGSPVFDGAPTPDDFAVGLSVDAAAGWQYLTVHDPSNGQYVLTHVFRSDGTELPRENYWQTDRTFIGGGAQAVYENNLQLLDKDSTGAYVLVYNFNDQVAPSSHVDSLPAYSSSDDFMVSWVGEDVGVSGLANFDVFVSVDNGAYSLWQQSTTQTGAIYHGQRGHSYRFYSIARDNADNIESVPNAADAQTSTATPKVTDVWIRGTTWASNFLGYLQGLGQGDSTLGYRIPTGGVDQGKALPWSNIGQVSIAFSEDVVITPQALAITGVNVASYTIAGFTYDAARHTATWTISTPFDVDQLQLTLPGEGPAAITNLAGIPLDGEWADGSSLASGDNLPGGDFVFHLNTLPADIDQSGLVDGGDFDRWFINLQSVTYDWTRGDVNADGLVDGGDFDLWFIHLQQRLPNILVETAAANAGAGTSPDEIVAMSSELSIASSSLQPDLLPIPLNENKKKRSSPIVRAADHQNALPVTVQVHLEQSPPRTHRKSATTKAHEVIDGDLNSASLENFNRRSS